MAKKNSQQEVRGRRKTTSFSMVANPIIDDKSITPAAGWLYVLIQRWITFNADDFICSKSFLLAKYNSGTYMFNRAWDELKEAGYLKMYSHPTEGWEFELLDEPKPNEPHTYYLDLNGEVKSTNVDRAAKKAAKEAEEKKNDHYPENHPNGDHYPENHSNGNHTNGNHSNGNEGNIINTSFNNSFNTFSNTNQSINHREEPEEPGQEPKKKNDRLIDRELIEDIKEQINCEYLREKGLEEEDINLTISILAELYTATEPVVINNRNYSPEMAKRRSLQIEPEHIQYVFDCLKKQSEKIYNIRAYLLTSIWNAPETLSAYYTNAVRADGAIPAR